MIYEAAAIFYKTQLDFKCIQSKITIFYNNNKNLEQAEYIFSVYKCRAVEVNSVEL